MNSYSRLMNIEEAIEYLNKKTNRDFNKDKTLKFINEKKIPIVFDYEGRGTWEFRAESGWKSHHIQVKGYFNFRNRNDAVQLFKGFLEEIDLEEAIIYKLKTAPVLKKVSDGIKPKKGDDILFGTGESSTFSNPFNTSDSQNSIKIDNSKVGVLKEDLEEYFNKVQTEYMEYMNSKTKIETLEAEIEKLKAENARLIQQHTEALTAVNDKIKQQEEDINRLNDQADKSVDTSHLLNDRNEKSYQTTIGLLLELMTVPKVEGDRPPFTSEAVIIGRITDKSIYGQGKTTLETRFSDAKITLEQTKKKAFKH